MNVTGLGSYTAACKMFIWISLEFAFNRKPNLLRRFRLQTLLCLSFKMSLNEEDNVVINFLRQNKNYSARKFIKEFPQKGGSLGGLKQTFEKD